jgi:23S rRNA (guanosine2251-2'-O)-methyltransferase
MSGSEVVYGRNPVRELIAAGRREVNEVWCLPDLAGEAWLRDRSPRPHTRAELGRACGSSDHQGVVAFCAPYPYVDADGVLAGSGPVVCLDGAQDPRNLGAVARVADAAGAAGVVVVRRGSPGVTPAVCKASAGAVEHVRVARVDNLAGFLHDARGAGRWADGADPQEGEDVRGVAFERDPLLVLGAEGRGLRPRVRAECDRLVRIPMWGRVGSLNLSVAAAILLHEARRSDPDPGASLTL